MEISPMPNLTKIEKLLNDSAYRELIEISASFNTRLCLERKLRLPFAIDNQTGVAQRHSNLYMNQRQRMPGIRNGQVYSYPSARWRKSRRQYLNKLQFNHSWPFSNIRNHRNGEAVACPINNTVLIVPPVLIVPNVNPPAIVDGEQSDFQALIDESNSNPNSVSLDTDSKDSQILKDELPKDWYFYEPEINDADANDGSEQGDSDYDYNINGYKRKRKRGKPAPRKTVVATTYHPSGNSIDSPRKGRPPGSLTGTGTRRCRSKTPRKKPTEPKSDIPSSESFQQLEAADPPSFESIEHDLNLNVNSNNQDTFRKYL